jgi:anti-sigma factor RsiW
MLQIEPNREWLLRYVLGELSEDETRQADERFFADDTFAGMIDEAYRDTLDSYAAGEIRGSDKERVERAFFSGPHQAGRLKILEAMQAIPERTPEVAVAAVGG